MLNLFTDESMMENVHELLESRTLNKAEILLKKEDFARKMEPIYAESEDLSKRIHSATVAYIENSGRKIFEDPDTFKLAHNLLWDEGKGYQKSDEAAEKVFETYELKGVSLKSGSWISNGLHSDKFEGYHSPTVFAGSNDVIDASEIEKIVVFFEKLKETFNKVYKSGQVYAGAPLQFEVPVIHHSFQYSFSIIPENSGTWNITMNGGFYPEGVRKVEGLSLFEALESLFNLHVVNGNDYF